MACRIKVIREQETQDSTMGTLYLNGNKIGYTLELPGGSKGKKESRIAEGIYSGVIKQADSSTRNHDTIQLINVPNKTGVQIHQGNYPKDISGGIVVGVEKGLNRVWSSEKALNKLLDKAQEGGIKVIIRNNL
ncbi:MAG: DUF5675 family protein [Bacillota bacterium]